MIVMYEVGGNSLHQPSCRWMDAPLGKCDCGGLSVDNGLDYGPFFYSSIVDAVEKFNELCVTTGMQPSIESARQQLGDAGALVDREWQDVYVWEGADAGAYIKRVTMPECRS